MEQVSWNFSSLCWILPNLADQQRRSGDTRFNRTGKAENIVPLLLNNPDIAFAADKDVKYKIILDTFSAGL
jgi:hypothetical protein